MARAAWASAVPHSRNVARRAEGSLDVAPDDWDWPELLELELDDCD
jgi:hypothetical protein